MVCDENLVQTVVNLVFSFLLIFRKTKAPNAFIVKNLPKETKFTVDINTYPVDNTLRLSKDVSNSV